MRIETLARDAVLAELTGEVTKPLAEAYGREGAGLTPREWFNLLYREYAQETFGVR